MRYDENEKRSQANSALRILIDSQKQTHSCVKSLTKEVMRNSAMTVANGVRIQTVIANCKPCKEKVAEMELWKAKHTGEASGKIHKTSKFFSNTRLICMVGGSLLALLGFWFTVVQPALDVSAEVLAQFKAINGSLSELNILK